MKEKENIKFVYPKIPRAIEVYKFNDISDSVFEFVEIDFKDEVVESKLDMVSFDSCKFSNMEFNGEINNVSSITDCEFENCVFTNLNITDFFARNVFKNCKLLGLKISDIRKVSNILFKECQLNYSVFADGKYENVIFDGCSLIECNFYNIEPKNVFYESCDLTKAEFYNFKLYKIDLSSCNIFGLKFRHEDLFGVILDRFQLSDIAGSLGIEVK